MENDEGLVAAPENLLDTPLHKAWAGLICVLFIGACAFIGLYDTLSPVPLRKLVGPELAFDSSSRANARIRNGSQMRVWSQDLDARSNAKATLLPWYLCGLIRFLQEADDGHIVGKDEWLFQRNRLQTPAIRNDARQAELGARLLRGAERRSARVGTQLLLLPVPRKGVVAGAKLPDGYDAFPGFERIVLQRLKSWGVPHVNMMELFQGYKPIELWFPHDTHWRPNAMTLVAEAVSKQLPIGIPRSKRPALEVLQNKRKARVGIPLTMGIPQGHAALGFLASGPGSPLLLQARQFRKHGVPRIWRAAQDVENPVWAITGSSFARGDMLIDLLANNLGSAPYNGARKGALGLQSLGDGLREWQGRLPAYWIAEFPFFQLFAIQTRAGSLLVSPAAMSLYAQTDPEEMQVLRELPQVNEFPVRLTNGTVVQEGDGSILIELELDQPATAAGAINIYQGNTASTVRWLVGTKRLRVPLFGYERSWDELIVLESPRTKLGPVRARLVCDYDLAGGTTALAQPFGEPNERGVWTQDYLFPTPQGADLHTALQVNTEDQLTTAWNVTLLPTTGSKNRDLGNLKMHASATALLFAGGPAGKTGTMDVAGVRIRGKGAPPGPETQVKLVQLITP